MSIDRSPGPLREWLLDHGMRVCRRAKAGDRLAESIVVAYGCAKRTGRWRHMEYLAGVFDEFDECWQS